MKRWKLIGAIALSAAILCRPEVAVSSAQQAMRAWYASVAPSLFPFLALMPVLTGPDACELYESMFSRFMRPVFRLPGSAAPAILIGVLSGSPAGAMGLRNVAARGMGKSELARLAPVICSVGPAYLVMGVGVGLLGSAQLGFALAASQLAAQMILLLAFRFAAREDEAVTPENMDCESRGLAAAVEAVLCVCGYMVVFAVASGVAATFIGELPGKLALIVADLPSGMVQLAAWDVPARNFLLGSAVGFGGLCIAAQNMRLLRPMGISWMQFLPVKCLQSVLTGAISAALMGGVSQNARPAMVEKASPYAFSMLIALVLCVPPLISLSNKLFLNKRKFEPRDGN